MSFDALKYFDPVALSAVGNLPLVARQVVEGFLSGRHRSPYHGFSIEFLDRRPYAPGDDLRSVDWKVLGRTDKYFVKRFEQETNLRATILLDCSRSMGFAGPGVSKLTYGSYLAAALTYLLLRQNDSVGLILFDDQVREYLPPKAHPSQYRRILERLDKVKPDRPTNVAAVMHQLADRLKRRGLIILIGDLIDDEAGVAHGLQHFRHRRHEVIVFQTLDPWELTFPYDRVADFRDMEGTAKVTANPVALRQKYLARIEAFTDRIKHECWQRKIGYELLDTSQPYAKALAAYLDKRARLG